MTKSSNATPGLSVGAVNTAHMNKNVKKKKKTNNFHKQKIINLNVFYLIIIYFIEKLFQIKYIMYGILILSWPSANSA